MKLLKIRALWGMNGSLEDQIKEVSKRGYDGVEVGVPSPEQSRTFRELLREYDLQYIAQVYTGGDHIDSLRKQVEAASEYGPLIINAHSAKDSMPYEEQLAYFGAALELEKSVGIPLAHETHRGRAMFTPWATARLLRDLPDLRITADFSHWCCVCESMLDDQKENLDLAIARTIHIHGRVGYEQGPQVPDFRAPEAEYALTRHESWWDAIWAARAAEGRPFLTFAPEFGPPGYLHTLPYTGQPVADLAAVCDAMMARFERRHAAQS